MENNLDEAKAALQKQVEELKNKTYTDWDSLVIQLQHGDTAKGTIRMMRQDMEALTAMHAAERKDVIEMMIQALEEQDTEKPVEKPN